MNLRSGATMLMMWAVLTAVHWNILTSPVWADKGQNGTPPKSPVKVAPVEQKSVAAQISLVGTTEALARSTVASEVAGLVVQYPVKEGDYVEKGALLAGLKSTYHKLSLKAVRAERIETLVNLQNAKKELNRIAKLRETNSVAEKTYDDAFTTHQALTQKLLQNEAEIDQLEYTISQTAVKAPFAGFVSKEHTQVGEWLAAGGAVVTLVDLSRVQITVDVPERYTVRLSRADPVDIIIGSLKAQTYEGRIGAVLPEGNPDARTFPVRIYLDNKLLDIKSGMEARVTFRLVDRRQVLLVPKDAIVAFGDVHRVIAVSDSRAKPVQVNLKGFYGHQVAVEGDLKPGDQVVVRGNERLRPGQAVEIQN